MKACLPPYSLQYVEFISSECFCTSYKDTSHGLFGYDSIQKHSPHSVLTLSLLVPVLGMCMVITLYRRRMQLVKGTWGIILIWRLMKSLKNLFLLPQYVLCQKRLWIPTIQDLAIWLKADNYLLTSKIPLANKISCNFNNNKNNNKFLLSGGHVCLLCNIPKCLASGLPGERLQPGQSQRSAVMPTGDSSRGSPWRPETGKTKSCSCYSCCAPLLPPQT